MQAFRKLSKARLSSASVCLSKRNYTPPSKAVALYETNFHLNYKFPVDLIDSSEVRYAQFLYRLQEESKSGKSKAGHCFTIDFQKLQSMKLPVFWEREVDVTKNVSFKKDLHENFVFLMKWMQSNGDLGKISEVKQYFDLLVNEKSKKAKAIIFLPSLDASKDLEDAISQKAKDLVLAEPSLEPFKSYAIDFSFSTDRSLASVDTHSKKSAKDVVNDIPFYVEVAGRRINYEPESMRVAAQEKKRLETQIDYSKIKTSKGVIKTKWDEGAELSVLSSYFEQLAKVDEEEQVYGV